MANILKLKSVPTETGILSVFEHLLPGKIERVYFIYGVPDESVRGGHRHKQTSQGLVCLNGSCKVYVQDEVSEKIFTLDSPDLCLLLTPKDWHQMFEFSESSILLVIANKDFDPSDYIDQPYFSKRISFKDVIVN